MRKFLLVFLFSMVFLAGASFSAEPLAAIKLPEPLIDHLANGLTVAWFPRDSIPVVDLIYVTKAGYRNDPVGKSGVTELLSSMMNRGAGEYSAAEFAREIESLGASRMVASDDDSFTVGLHGLATDSDRLLELLSKQVLNPLFLEDDFVKEHAKILDRLGHLGDSADVLASLVFHRMTANGTEYFRAGFASKKEFLTVRYTDVVNQYKHIFTPGQGVLILIGRVKRELLLPRLEKEFGHWTAPEVKTPVAVNSEKRFQMSPNRVLVVGRKELTQAEVRMGFRFPKPEIKDRYSAAVFNALMGEYFNSRLNLVLRDQLALTYSVSTSFSYNHSYGRWVMSAATRNEKVGEFLKKTIELLKKSVNEGVSEDEVAQAKAYLLGSYPIGMSTLSAIASRWLVGQIYGMDSSFLNAYPAGIAAVTKTDIDAWIKKNFKVDEMTKVVSGDEIPVQKSLALAGFKSVQKFQIDELLK